MTQPTSPSASSRAAGGDPDPNRVAAPQPQPQDQSQPQNQPQPRRRGLRGLLGRLTADTTRLQAEELQERTFAAGAQPIAQCPNREPVCIAGTLRTVTIRPRAGVPSLEANLWDGTGDVAVIWLGRREIPGIGPGRHMRVRGRITTLGGHRAIYNPIYELLPSSAD